MPDVVSADAITVDHVRDALNEVAYDTPTAVDLPRDVGAPMAHYITDGKPTCLLARVLLRVGFSPTVLYEIDRGTLLRTGERIAQSGHAAMSRLDDRALALLQFIQDCQDRCLSYHQVALAAFAPRRLRLLRLDRIRRPWLY